MGKMKDYRIWVEVAEKARKCHRCGGSIGKGIMFVRMGDRSRSRGARSMCAACFELVMDDLSHDFQDLKAANPLPPTRTEGVMAALGEPRCFVCGQTPERCQCGREAYR